MGNGRLMHSVVILLLLSACSLFTADKSPSAKNSYQFSHLPADWKQKQDSNYDYLFYGPQGSSLMIQSFCNEFQSPSLESLARTTFHSLEPSHITEQKEFILQDRAALISKGVASVDGVKVYLTLINSKRNNCYYDFLEVITHSNSPTIMNQFLKGLTFK